METNIKVLLYSLLSVVVATISYFIKGKEGSLYGFVFTWIVIGMFWVFKRSYRNE